ncbi:MULTISPECIES: AIM24 family protein [unclassified Streptomyces]|uniref:AIM24 family protein n=1 Tax=unclassified Streptomyces TaxID=2593676 RepID=UPI000DAC3EA3|nr:MULTISPECIES: AIM24 family protein [unclassified Streptomyces]PZT76538.1 AIM24 family protein [Streptomyces sp. AC1-42W]PZT79504.1 AIM24 family protein [Streptomyces sp. AC1-42T]WUC95870.1 AIM24 family protein [Streptomyces sp. NBC_00525]
MQSSLFGLTEAQSQERYALQNPQLLRVALTGHDDVLARKGAMVAYQGLMEFDGEYQSSSQRRSRAHTGEGLDLMRCSGQGTVYLANLAQYIHVVDVDHDGLTVDSSYVLALDSSLHTEVIAVDSQYGISGTGKYQLNISGTGKVALMTSGQPLMMQVTPDKYVSADADAIVAWSTSLRVQMQAQTHSSGVFRRRGNTGEGWELSFLGQGFALVQPSELMPPQNAQIGQGLAAQYGMGQHGAHGQNQNNSWN